MKKNLFGFLLGCLPFFTIAQVTLNAQLPQSGMVQKDQLWNLVVSNNSNDILTARLSLVLKDPASGDVILSANSGVILLSKGLKIISSKDIQPVDYNMVAGNFNGSYLPAGSYLACYRLSAAVGEDYKTVADECVRLKINPLSPPLLNTPANQSVLKNNLPQFTWVAPAPLEMFDNLSYSLNLVEVLNGQSSADAIQYNIPVYQKGFTKLTYENYPSSFSTLESGKTYAWQVAAKNGDNYSVNTEIWTFQISKDPIVSEAASSSYILLKNNYEQTGISYISSDTLFIKYYSYDKEHESTVRFYNSDRKLLQEKKQHLIYGDNFLMFKLNRLYKKDEVYIIEIADSKNNIHSASFSIK